LLQPIGRFRRWSLSLFVRPVKLWLIPLACVVAEMLYAQDSTRGVALNDPLLDRLVGHWNLERTFPSGRVAKNVVDGEWVLQHQFVRLLYRDIDSPPHYEAIVLIGYDGIGKRYICHWADNFGGAYSGDGFAVRDEGSNAMEFKFEFHDGKLTNRFAFDPKSQTWSSTIRQIEKGEWKLFCEDRFTPIGRDAGKR
jgi:hypothetical protein